MITKWTGAINLEENYGAHTLRKNRGYIQQKKYGRGFEIVCKWFNHSRFRSHDMEITYKANKTVTGSRDIKTN
jgi:hypothetical protein